MTARPESQPLPDPWTEERHDPTVLIAVTRSPAARARLADAVQGIGVLVLADDLDDVRALLGPVAADDIDEVPVGRTVEGMVIDPRTRLVSWHGEPLRLTPQERSMLYLLTRDMGRAWTYDELHRSVWNTEHLPRGSDLASAVKRLRHKLAAAGVPVTIETVRGVGYRVL